MKEYGYWNNGTLPMVEVDGEIFVLAGWNGEKYTDCWKCKDQWTEIDDGEYSLRPVYRFEDEEIDLDSVEENSEEWYKLTEIVDYNVSKN